MYVSDITDAKAIKPWEPARRAFTTPCKMLDEVEALPLAIANGVLTIPCGIEVECEGVKDQDVVSEMFWLGKEDDSLRVNGYEYITKLGMRIGHCGDALTQLMSIAQENEWKVSDRTSIHVHLNVLNMTMAQLNGLVILYTVFEQSLFNYASVHRAHNIFCVPFESHLFARNYNDMPHVVAEATKYSSLNLKAIREHGTVEFRHMETLYEVAPVWNWVMLLGLLHRYATITPLGQIKEQVSRLKIMSEYDAFLKRIFYGYSRFLKYNPIDLDSAVSDSKLLFFEG